jgi:hypothetical protein
MIVMKFPGGFGNGNAGGFHFLSSTALRVARNSGRKAKRHKRCVIFGK